MAPDPPQPPAARSGLSLYANLLNPQSTTNAPSSASTIARAPVLFNNPSASAPDAQPEETAKKQVNAAALRFQPAKRPQLQAHKPKPKTGLSATISAHLSSTPPVPSSSPPAAVDSQRPLSHSEPAPPHKLPPVRSTLADWAADDDDDVNGFYAGEKRQRGGRKKRKKNAAAAEAAAKQAAQNWDDIYDPSRPNNYEDFKHSEEKYREIREWKDRLYAHRLAQHRRGSNSSSENSEGEGIRRARMNSQFAPPSSYSFAPPAFDEPQAPPPPQHSPSPPPPPPAIDVPDDATGDDAYARRLKLTQAMHGPPPPPPPPDSSPPVESPTLPPQTISRAPVRYNLPAPPAEIPASEAALASALASNADADVPMNDADSTPEPRSTRPGQAGFAKRLMAKYGWTAGQGLGAQGNEGIVKPLQVQVEKRKKRSDAEGGGFIGPGGRGKIIESVKGRAKSKQDDGGSGEMELSEVVVLVGMLDGIDLDKEMESGGLMQEIGDECAEKYGRVERVFIHSTSQAQSIPVFVKFTSPLSALRAISALSGRVFNGNTITARYYPAEQFNAGNYGHGM